MNYWVEKEQQMKEQIDRKDLIAEYDRVHIGPPGGARKLMEDAPAVDAVEVVHGRWEQKKHKIFGNTYDYVCSVCGCDYALAEYNYCPNCGAKMDGDGNG